MKILQFSGYFRLDDNADVGEVEIAFEDLAEYFLGPEPEGVDDSAEAPETVVGANPSDPHWVRFWDTVCKGRRLYVTAGISEVEEVTT